MKLHRNAALSWSGRRRLAEAVVLNGSTVVAAAAAGVSVRCARRWIARYRQEGEQGLSDRPSAPYRVANRTPAERVELILRLRRLRFTAARDRGDARAGALDRLGGAEAGRDGPARTARARAAASLRVRPAGRARPPRRQEARTDRGRRRLARPRRPPALQPHLHRSRGQAPQHRRVGVRAHRRGRLQPLCLRGAARRREGRDRRRFPAPHACPLPAPRHPRGAVPDRQRLLLPI